MKKPFIFSLQNLKNIKYTTHCETTFSTCLEIVKGLSSQHYSTIKSAGLIPFKTLINHLNLLNLYKKNFRKVTDLLIHFTHIIATLLGPPFNLNMN